MKSPLEGDKSKNTATIKTLDKPLRSKLLIRILSLVFLLVSSSVTATEVYRSVDENGRATFTNTPPADNNDHEVIDIEVQNDLGAPNQPDPNSLNKHIYHSPPRTSRSYKSTSRYRNKVDMRTLQARCESYRNSGANNDYHRKRREYWCGRLHRGK